MTQVSILGLGEAVRALRKFGDEAEAELQKAVSRTAQAIRSDAVRSIQQVTSRGRVYELYSPRRTHTASLPGFPPNTDTGRLAGSIRVDQQRLYADVGSDLEYALYLEYGTTGMGARPFLAPALEKNRQAWESAIQRAVHLAMRGTK